MSSSDDLELFSILSEEQLGAMVTQLGKAKFGVLDSEFLRHSLSILNPKPPVTVSLSDPLKEVVKLFSKHRIGSVVVVNDSGKLKGIFTERDFIIRGMPDYPANGEEPISVFMTPDPLAQTPDVTIAFALNLMSHGHFRHIPIVDDQNNPIGIVSIRDVIDHIVDSFVLDLLNFKTES